METFIETILPSVKFVGGAGAKSKPSNETDTGSWMAIGHIMQPETMRIANVIEYVLKGLDADVSINFDPVVSLRNISKWIMRLEVKGIPKPKIPSNITTENANSVATQIMEYLMLLINEARNRGSTNTAQIENFIKSIEEEFANQPGFENAIVGNNSETKLRSLMVFVAIQTRLVLSSLLPKIGILYGIHALNNNIFDRYEALLQARLKHIPDVQDVLGGLTRIRNLFNHLRKIAESILRDDMSYLKAGINMPQITEFLNAIESSSQSGMTSDDTKILYAIIMLAGASDMIVRLSKANKSLSQLIQTEKLNLQNDNDLRKALTFIIRNRDDPELTNSFEPGDLERLKIFMDSLAILGNDITVAYGGYSEIVGGAFVRDVGVPILYLTKKQTEKLQTVVAKTGTTKQTQVLTTLVRMTRTFTESTARFLEAITNVDNLKMDSKIINQIARNLAEIHKKILLLPRNAQAFHDLVYALSTKSAPFSMMPRLRLVVDRLKQIKDHFTDLSALLNKASNSPSGQLCILKAKQASKSTEALQHLIEGHLKELSKFPANSRSSASKVVGGGKRGPYIKLQPSIIQGGTITPAGEAIYVHESEIDPSMGFILPTSCTNCTTMVGGGVFRAKTMIGGAPIRYRNKEVRPSIINGASAIARKAWNTPDLFVAHNTAHDYALMQRNGPDLHEVSDHYTGGGSEAPVKGAAEPAEPPAAKAPDNEDFGWEFPPAINDGPYEDDLNGLCSCQGGNAPCNCSGGTAPRQAPMPAPAHKMNIMEGGLTSTKLRIIHPKGSFELYGDGILPSNLISGGDIQIIRNQEEIAQQYGMVAEMMATRAHNYMAETTIERSEQKRYNLNQFRRALYAMRLFINKPPPDIDSFQQIEMELQTYDYKKKIEFINNHYEWGKNTRTQLLQNIDVLVASLDFIPKAMSEINKVMGAEPTRRIDLPMYTTAEREIDGFKLYFKELINVYSGIAHPYITYAGTETEQGAVEWINTWDGSIALFETRDDPLTTMEMPLLVPRPPIDAYLPINTDPSILFGKIRDCLIPMMMNNVVALQKIFRHNVPKQLVDIFDLIIKQLPIAMLAASMDYTENPPLYFGSSDEIEMGDGGVIRNYRIIPDPPQSVTRHNLVHCMANALNNRPVVGVSAFGGDQVADRFHVATNIMPPLGYITGRTNCMPSLLYGEGVAGIGAGIDEETRNHITQIVPLWRNRIPINTRALTIAAANVLHKVFVGEEITLEERRAIPQLPFTDIDKWLSQMAPPNTWKCNPPVSVHYYIRDDDSGPGTLVPPLDPLEPTLKTPRVYFLNNLAPRMKTVNAELIIKINEVLMSLMSIHTGVILLNNVGITRGINTAASATSIFNAMAIVGGGRDTSLTHVVGNNEVEKRASNKETPAPDSADFTLIPVSQLNKLTLNDLADPERPHNLKRDVFMSVFRSNQFSLKDIEGDIDKWPPILRNIVKFRGGDFVKRVFERQARFMEKNKDGTIQGGGNVTASIESLNPGKPSESKVKASTPLLAKYSEQNFRGLYWGIFSVQFLKEIIQQIIRIKPQYMVILVNRTKNSAIGKIIDLLQSYLLEIQTIDEVGRISAAPDTKNFLMTLVGLMIPFAKEEYNGNDLTFFENIAIPIQTAIYYIDAANRSEFVEKVVKKTAVNVEAEIERIKDTYSESDLLLPDELAIAATANQYTTQFGMPASEVPPPMVHDPAVAQAAQAAQASNNISDFTSGQIPNLDPSFEYTTQAKIGRDDLIEKMIEIMSQMINKDSFKSKWDFDKFLELEFKHFQKQSTPDTRFAYIVDSIEKLMGHASAEGGPETVIDSPLTGLIMCNAMLTEQISVWQRLCLCSFIMNYDEQARMLIKLTQARFTQVPNNMITLEELRTDATRGNRRVLQDTVNKVINYVMGTLIPSMKFYVLKQIRNNPDYYQRGETVIYINPVTLEFTTTPDTLLGTTFPVRLATLNDIDAEDITIQIRLLSDNDHLLNPYLPEEEVALDTILGYFAALYQPVVWTYDNAAEDNTGLKDVVFEIVRNKLVQNPINPEQYYIPGNFDVFENNAQFNIDTMVNYLRDSAYRCITSEMILDFLKQALELDNDLTLHSDEFFNRADPVVNRFRDQGLTLNSVFDPIISQFKLNLASDNTDKIKIMKRVLLESFPHARIWNHMVKVLIGIANTGSTTTGDLIKISINEDDIKFDCTGFCNMLRETIAIRQAMKENLKNKIPPVVFNLISNLTLCSQNPDKILYQLASPMGPQNQVPMMEYICDSIEKNLNIFDTIHKSPLEIGFRPATVLNVVRVFSESIFPLRNPSSPRQHLTGISKSMTDYIYDIIPAKYTPNIMMPNTLLPMDSLSRLGFYALSSKEGEMGYVHSALSHNILAKFNQLITLLLYSATTTSRNDRDIDWKLASIAKRILDRCPNSAYGDRLSSIITDENFNTAVPPNALDVIHKLSSIKLFPLTHLDARDKNDKFYIAHERPNDANDASPIMMGLPPIGTVLFDSVIDFINNINMAMNPINLSVGPPMPPTGGLTRLVEFEAMTPIQRERAIVARTMLAEGAGILYEYILILYTAMNKIIKLNTARPLFGVRDELPPGAPLPLQIVNTTPVYSLNTQSTADLNTHGHDIDIEYLLLSLQEFMKLTLTLRDDLRSLVRDIPTNDFHNIPQNFHPVSQSSNMKRPSTTIPALMASTVVLRPMNNQITGHTPGTLTDQFQYVVIPGADTVREASNLSRNAQMATVQGQLGIANTYVALLRELQSTLKVHMDTMEKHIQQFRMEVQGTYFCRLHIMQERQEFSIIPPLPTLNDHPVGRAYAMRALNPAGSDWNLLAEQIENYIGLSSNLQHQHVYHMLSLVYDPIMFLQQCQNFEGIAPRECALQAYFDLRDDPDLGGLARRGALMDFSTYINQVRCRGLSQQVTALKQLGPSAMHNNALEMFGNAANEIPAYDIFTGTDPFNLANLRVQMYGILPREGGDTTPLRNVDMSPVVRALNQMEAQLTQLRRILAHYPQVGPRHPLNAKIRQQGPVLFGHDRYQTLANGLIPNNQIVDNGYLRFPMTSSQVEDSIVIVPVPMGNGGAETGLWLPTNMSRRRIDGTLCSIISEIQRMIGTMSNQYIFSNPQLNNYLNESRNYVSTKFHYLNDVTSVNLMNIKIPTLMSQNNLNNCEWALPGHRNETVNLITSRIIVPFQTEHHLKALTTQSVQLFNKLLTGSKHKEGIIPTQQLGRFYVNTLRLAIHARVAGMWLGVDVPGIGEGDTTTRYPIRFMPAILEANNFRNVLHYITMARRFPMVRSNDLVAPLHPNDENAGIVEPERNGMTQITPIMEIMSRIMVQTHMYQIISVSSMLNNLTCFADVSVRAQVMRRYLINRYDWIEDDNADISYRTILPKLLCPTTPLSYREFCEAIRIYHGKTAALRRTAIQPLNILFGFYKVLFLWRDISIEHPDDEDLRDAQKLDLLPAPFQPANLRHYAPYMITEDGTRYKRITSINIPEDNIYACGTRVKAILHQQNLAYILHESIHMRQLIMVRILMVIMESIVASNSVIGTEASEEERQLAQLFQSRLSMEYN